LVEKPVIMMGSGFEEPSPKTIETPVFVMGSGFGELEAKTIEKVDVAVNTDPVIQD